MFVENSGGWSKRREDREEDRFTEASYSLLSEVGEARLRPPSLTGRANNLLSYSPGESHPVKIGMSLILITSSRGGSR